MIHWRSGGARDDDMALVVLKGEEGRHWISIKTYFELVRRTGKKHFTLNPN